jgi:hypothetical protein
LVVAFAFVIVVSGTSYLSQIRRVTIHATGQKRKGKYDWFRNNARGDEQSAMAAHRTCTLLSNAA